MIAATIGKTFLKTFNEKTGKNYSAKEFFEKEYIPLFFNHPKYLMTGGNSPLENPKIPKGTTPSAEDRKLRIAKTINTIESNRFDASVAIGFPASEGGNNGFQPYSGQTTDIQLPFTISDKYLTWIGSGFGICLKGALSIYFDDVEIIWKIYEGWKVYREALNDKSLPQFRGNQIEAWNAQWLNFNYDKRLYRDDFDFARLHNSNVFHVDTNVVEVNMLTWVKLFFSLSKEFPEKKIIGYVYSLGSKGNTTVGFVPFNFQSATNLLNLYKMLFGENMAIENATKYEEIFGQEFRKACSYGTIGLKALEPSSLRDKYGVYVDLNLSKPTKSDEKTLQKDYENIITYRTYKTWLLAMITKNKEESLEYTAEVAKALHEYRDKASKNDRKNLIDKELLSAKSKKQFLDALVTIVKEVEQESLQVFKTLRDKVHLMSAEDFGYFVVLLKFDYAYAERERN